MRNVGKKVLAFLREEEDGQDLVEYALLVGFIAVAAGAILPGVSKSLGALADPTIIRVVCAILAVVLLGVIVMRRKA